MNITLASLRAALSVEVEHWLYINESLAFGTKTLKPKKFMEKLFKNTMEPLLMSNLILTMPQGHPQIFTQKVFLAPRYLTFDSRMYSYWEYCMSKVPGPQA